MHLVLLGLMNCVRFVVTGVTIILRPDQRLEASDESLVSSYFAETGVPVLVHSQMVETMFYTSFTMYRTHRMGRTEGSSVACLQEDCRLTAQLTQTMIHDGAEIKRHV